MGGMKQACGCFDGPFAAENPTLVSIRCDDHLDVPALDGYAFVSRRALFVTRRRQRLPERMAIPKGKRRK